MPARCWTPGLAELCMCAASAELRRCVVECVVWCALGQRRYPRQRACASVSRRHNDDAGGGGRRLTWLGLWWRQRLRPGRGRVVQDVDAGRELTMAVSQRVASSHELWRGHDSCAWWNAASTGVPCALVAWRELGLPDGVV